MADGITQPGGAGTPLLIQNDANADAGGDGSYSFADISTKFPAVLVDLGTTPKSYRSTVSITNGDGTAGVGTTTTLKDSNCTVIFDAGFTYSVSATGRSTRFTEFGVKVSGTKNSGRSGVRLVGGTTLNIGANWKFYGSMIENVTGSLTLAPGTSGLACEIINSIVYCPLSSVTLGNAGGAINTAYNVDIIGGTAGLAAITNFNVTSAERITVAINAGGVRHMQTGAALQATDVVFIGAALTDQLRNTGVSEWDLVAPTWEQGVGITSAANSGNINSWRIYNIAATDQNGTGISGLPFTLTDRTGATIISTTTTATGEISYGSGVTANCIKVVVYGVAGAIDYRGPFTARVNQGAGANPNYPSRTIAFDFDVTATWLSNYKQYGDMYDIIQLIPPGGLPTGWVERVVT